MTHLGHRVGAHRRSGDFFTACNRMSMPLVKMEKSEEGPEIFGLKFQMDVWLLMSMGMEI